MQVLYKPRLFKIWKRKHKLKISKLYPEYSTQIWVEDSTMLPNVPAIPTFPDTNPCFLGWKKKTVTSHLTEHCVRCFRQILLKINRQMVAKHFEHDHVTLCHAIFKNILTADAHLSRTHTTCIESLPAFVSLLIDWALWFGNSWFFYSELNNLLLWYGLSSTKCCRSRLAQLKVVSS